MTQSYRDKLLRIGALIERVEASAQDGSPLDMAEAMRRAGEILSAHTAGGKVMFIGNGASAAIASHMSTDYWKNGRMRATAFNDGAQLTCMGNDYGYACVFEKPVEMFADPGDTLVAISSSGRSENILRGGAAALAKGCRVITLSGFSPENPLRARGAVNFFVPCEAYGPVEVLHHAICHAILDTLVEAREGGA